MKKILIVFLGFILGCTNSPEKPQVNLLATTNGLEVIISGNVTDMEGSITKVIIDWDENGLIQTLSNDFAIINETHKYKNEGAYEILVTAIDSTGDSTLVSYGIEASYLATSLEGINPDLYKSSSNELLFLTLNLHTYQENNQNEKLNMIVDVISTMDIDFITFQECAQHKNSELVDGIIRDDNMAFRIANLLETKYGVTYNFNWDWGHYGWNVWEEGVATMSKYPVLATDSRYVSSSTSKTSITSRKVVYSAFDLEDKTINLFSAHTHWRTSETSEEQNNQIKNIQSMVTEKETPNSYSFVAGDFNGNPTSDYPWSEGYNTMVKNNNFIDTYLVANPDANHKPAQSKYYTVLGDFPGRIDYVFMKNNALFEVKSSQIIFNKNVLGKVSDHYGVLTKVGIK